MRAISVFKYTKLWVMLAENEMNKTELRKAINMGPATLAKMSKGQPVSMIVLARVCDLFECNIGDVVDYKLDQLEDEDE